MATTPLTKHWIIGRLRAVRDPKGKQLAVVDTLCRGEQKGDGDRRLRLPTDAEIARQLGMSVRTVRQHIWSFATLIEGLEMLEPRARIYVWYWHREWEKLHGHPLGGSR